MTPQPPRLQLSAEHVALAGAYLMDVGDFFYLYVGKVAPQFFCEKVRQLASYRTVVFSNFS